MTPAFAVLGLGEAGREIADGLRAAGAAVRGYDVVPERSEAASAAEATEGADLVLSVSTSAAAEDAAQSVVAALRPGQLYADLNSASPATKRAVAAIVEPTGAGFADVALMAPVPGRGVGVPALASGAGAPRFAELMTPLGMPVEVVGLQPGQAAERKLVRSVFMKGLAAAVLETLAAARATGCEPWAREELGEVIGEPLVRRLEEGSRRHAARRVREVADAAALLRSVGVEPRVCEASRGWLETLADG